jgi:thiol-disulfide isomerase/thioredoxin
MYLNMQIRISLILLLCISISSLFGQNKYYYTMEGTIIDTIAYEKMKDQQIEKIRSNFPAKDIKININESFKEVKKTDDSLIYTYKWEIKIGDSKRKETKSLQTEDLINKELPLPILNTVNNQRISINELKGKPTLINFWFTTCKPCIEEMPVLNKIKDQLKDSVNFIAITFETSEKVKAFSNIHQFNYIQISGAQKFIDSISMKAFPVNIFLDKNRIVRKIENGIPYILDENDKMKMGDGKEFIVALRELLK